MTSPLPLPLPRLARLAGALLLVAGLAATGLVALVPEPASAGTARGQLTYTCDVAGEGYEADAEPYPFVTALQLDVPAQVSPGDTLTLSGRFSVQLPEDLRALAEDYFTYAQAVSTSITVPVVVGGRTTVLRASRFDSGKVPTKNQPLILSSVVTAQPFRVPAGAGGTLDVELPRNGTTPSNIDRSKVAFTAEALFSGGFVATFAEEYLYKAACRAPAQARRTVARIPVSGGAAAPGSSTGTATTPGAAADTGAGATPGSTPGAATGTSRTTGTTGEVPASDVAGDPFAASGPSSAGPATSAAGADLLPAAGGAVSVPGWAVVLAAGVAVLAALLLAGWSQHRIRVLRTELGA